MIAVTVGLILLAAELVARRGYPPEPVRRVWDPFAYRIPAPGLVDVFEGLDGETATVRIDDLGMRTWTAAPSSTRGEAGTERAPLRLVFLGGSTTENYAFQASETFPGRVGAAVAAAIGRPVEVRNAGASGATTAVTLGRLQHQVIDLRPDLVVVMHAINDLVAGFAPGYRADQRHLAMPPSGRSRSESRLLAWLRGRRPRGHRPSTASAAVAPPVDDWTRHPSYRPFVRNLRSILAVAERHELPVLFVTQPTTYATGDDARFRLINRHRMRGIAIPGSASLAQGMDVFNAATRAAAGEASATLFDLARTMPADPALFLDECHYTRAGNDEVAKRLAPVVIALVGSFDGG